jgi:hypothetical protein
MMQLKSSYGDVDTHMKRDAFYFVCHVTSLPEHTQAYATFTGFRSPDNNIKTLMRKEE